MLSVEERIGTTIRQVQGGRPYECTAGQRSKKLPRAPPKSAPSTRQSCLLSTIDLTAGVHRIRTPDFSKKDLHRIKKYSIKTELPPSKHANTHTAQSEMRRRGGVGFAGAKRGRADGGCSKSRRVEHPSPLRDSAKWKTKDA